MQPHAPAEANTGRSSPAHAQQKRPGELCRGRAEIAPITFGPAGNSAALGEDQLMSNARESDGPRERPKLNDVLGLALPTSVFQAATEQDPYCLVTAHKSGVEVPEEALASVMKAAKRKAPSKTQQKPKEEAPAAEVDPEKQARLEKLERMCSLFQRARRAALQVGFERMQHNVKSLPQISLRTPPRLLAGAKP
eukprot:CAMPEP_0179330142 /NCGR_PEP_ID=MMETSP0797-20121207/63508_1 /TAXON_ID=47934 /ORGANISM="Dinophysis acuminata, Strain DAEP01" /LENGTH=193 /DNA_ID=CAMNT_0021042855 /DNA_START=1 /DNA_END=578 /DNA_ORIENTATION=-